MRSLLYPEDDRRISLDDFLARAMKSWPVPTRTGTVHLVRQDGDRLAVMLGWPALQAEAKSAPLAQRAISGKTAMERAFAGTDHRGIAAIGVVQTLFAREDYVEEAWRIVDSIVGGWKQSKRRPDEYVAGTWGPERANELLGTGRTWRQP